MPQNSPPQSDSQQPTADGSAPSWRIRAAFWLTLSVGLIATFELLSFFTLGLLYRTANAPAAVRQQRQDTLEQTVNLESPRSLKTVIHPYQGFVLNADGGEFIHGQARSRLRVSEFGFVDEQSPLQRRSPERVIIAITGGSVALQIATVGAETLLQELQASPQFAGQELILVRLAISGYKQPQQLMTLQYLLSLGAEFDVVINLDGFNEVALHQHENAPSGTYYAFPRHWRAAAGSADQQLRLVSGKLALFQSLRQRWAKPFSTMPIRYSATANLLWMVGHRALGRQAMRAQYAMRKMGASESKQAFLGPNNPAIYSQMYSELVALWSRSSIQMDRISKANQIRYFHFLQPNQYVVGSKPMGAPEQRVAISADHAYRPGAEAGFPLLISAGQELEKQLRFTDLTPLFADVTAPVYSDGCCHFNERGSRMIAKEIARVILADG